MPKLPNVLPEVLIDVLKEYIPEIPIHLNQPSSEFWKTISRRFDYKITAKSIYTFIKCNRHNCQNILGLNIIPNKDIYPDADDNELSSEEELSYKSFLLNSDQWNLIKPEQSHGIRPRLRLKAGWTDIFSSYLAQNFDETCTWIFKNHNIYPNGKHFLTFSCHCKECGAIIKGFNSCGPNEDNTFTITCNYSQGDLKLHSGSTVRNLSGLKRDEVGKILALGKSACNWRREEAFYNMYKSDSEEMKSTIYSLPVLRKCKQEYLYKKSPASKLTKYPVLNLEMLKYTQPYNTSIKQINLDKFQLIYWSPEQLEIFKEYCKKTLVPKVAIDATGTLVTKIQRPYNYQSGHIFLYSAIIHTGMADGQIPVSQMLSEAHDIDSIAYWLKLWIKNIHHFPKIVICDHSMALLGAISLSFNSLLLKDYIKMTFNLITKKTSDIPNIMIRVDYAHIIKLIGHWESLRKKPRLFREFFLRSMTLIIKSHDISHATYLIESLFIISLSEYSGSNNGILTPCEERKRMIKGLISGCDITDINDDTENIPVLNDNEEESIETYNEIMIWISGMKQNISRFCNFETEDENYHFNPGFVKDLSNLLKTFPLWSAITNRFFGYGNPTESSAIVESYFNDLKNRTFKQHKLPIRIDKFFISHFQAIQGMLSLSKHSWEKQTIKTESINSYERNDSEAEEIANENTEDNTKIKENQEIEDILESVADVSKVSAIEESPELRTQVIQFTNDKEVVENWHNLAKEPSRKRRRICYYGIPCPEILYVQEGKKMKIGLLKNGNMIQKPTLISSKNKVFVLNTCAFDSFFQAIAASYCDSFIFKSFVDSKDQSNIFSLVKLFLQCGPKLSVYKLRACILHENQNIFQTNKLKTGTTQIICDCNITLIASKIFNAFPSAIENYSCSSDICSIKNKTRIIDILPININIVKESGFKDLEKSIVEGRLLATICQLCKNLINYEMEIQTNIFLDTNGCGECALIDIPCSIKLYQKTYILRSVIHFVEPSIKGGVGHYITFCRRIDSMWERYDDLQKNPENSNNSTVVCPHMLIFTE